MSDLREGLKSIVRDIRPQIRCEPEQACLDCDVYAEDVADAILEHIRQHDGHTEFVRKVREFAENMQTYNTGRATAGHALIALCDAEIAKETSNG